MRLFLSCCILLMMSTAQAAPEGRTSSKSKSASLLRKKFYQLEIGYNIWHEDVPANSGGTDGDIPMQFHGFKLGGSYQIPLSNFRWVQYYGADFSFGVAKGIGKGPVTDELKDQPWMAFTAKPGIVYRATAVSEFGLVLPLAYRKVNWKLDSSAQLSLGDKAFSVGLGAMFINRFTPYSSLLVSVTHQHMWKSTLWGISWQYDFK